MSLFNSEGISHPSQLLSRVLAALGFFTSMIPQLEKEVNQEALLKNSEVIAGKYQLRTHPTFVGRHEYKALSERNAMIIF